MIETQTGTMGKAVRLRARCQHPALHLVIPGVALLAQIAVGGDDQPRLGPGHGNIEQAVTFSQQRAPFGVDRLG